MSETPEFPGARRLVAFLDGAVAAPSTEETVRAVQEGLERLIRGDGLSLPERFRAPKADGYARRRLYRSADHGYTVLAMAWGPGQATPLHDHAGIWCVEGVVEGRMKVARYELLERDGERFRFRHRETVDAAPGSAGSLIPPFEYHVLGNADPRGTSVTLHVYGGELSECSTFEPCGEGWYERQLRQLHLDA